MGPAEWIASLAVTGAGWLAGFAVLGRLRECSVDQTTPAPRALSIIIPSRNEAARLPTLLKSIQAQDVQPTQVIVVDDGSTDDTAGVARQLGARVISPGDLPDGWRGKAWACKAGAEAATGELLLFLDADTWFEPGGLRKILDTYPSGALSVVPFHVVRQPYEQLSAFFNLVMTAGIGAFTIVERPPDGLFGQMMLVDRVSYETVGGHAAVREKILENLWLARAFRSAGVPVQCRVGRGVLSMRMYPDGIVDLVKGWGKAFASGASATSPVILFGVIVWLSGAVSATALLIRSPSMVPATVYALYAIQCAWLLHKLGSFKLYTAVLFPIPLAFFFGVFARSTMRRRRGVEWKGRLIHAD